MRFVFTDEAGTSAARHEVVRVVASVIAHADHHVVLAEAAIKEALRVVPEEFRGDFNFHAEDIMNNKKYRDRWSLTDRANLIKSIISIPRKMGMPVSFGIVHADSPKTGFEIPQFTLAQNQHISAFLMSITFADEWIIDNSAPGEVATLVCEQNDLASAFQIFLQGLRENPNVMPPNMFRKTQEDKIRGYNMASGTFGINRIRKAIHFVGKGDDNMVWIADACAFGMKRYLSNRDFGDDFCLALNGWLFNKADFVGPASRAIFPKSPPWSTRWL